MLLGVLLLLSSILILSVEVSSDEIEHTDDYVPRFFGGRLAKEAKTSAGGPKGHGRLKNARHRTLQLPPEPATLNFTQKLDHFDSENSDTWQQRYFVNDAYFKRRPNGPIFIILGGEARMDPYQVIDGPMIRLAQKYEALVLGLEHRFYGDSRPTKDTSVKNLRFLNSQQALADLNHFIKSQRRKYRCKNPNARIVLYGCSYSGSLAAYFTELYPEEKVRAIAGFAPMVAVENFDRYFEGIVRALDVQDPLRFQNCELSLASALGRIWVLMNFANDQILNEEMNLCEPKVLNYSNPNAIDSLYYEVMSILMIKAQYNNAHLGENSELSSLCRNMTEQTYPCKCAKDFFEGKKVTNESLLFVSACCDLEKYMNWLNAVDGSCIIHNGAGIAARSVSWESRYVKLGTRQWLWQMCTEFGYFTSTPFNYFHLDSRKGLKGMRISLEYLQKSCPDSFGITNMTENVARTNSFYGKLFDRKKFASAYFLSSKSDPWYGAHKLFEDKVWHTGGSTVLEKISHCYEPMGDGSDPKELIDAWIDIDKTIAKWFQYDDIKETAVNVIEDVVTAVSVAVAKVGIL